MRKDVRRKVNISLSEESLLNEDTTSQALALQYDGETQNVKPGSKASTMHRLEEINKELLLTYLDGDRHNIKKRLAEKPKQRKNIRLNRVSW